MSNSYQRVPSDGTMVLLDISIDYLDRDEITVYFDDVLTTAWIWSGTSDKRILFPTPVPNGVVVMVKRTTDASKLRHVFSEGAKFTAPNLDEDLKQALHMAQEASEANLVGDFFTDINLHGFRLYNVGPAVDDTDAVTLGQYRADAAGAAQAKTAAEAAAAVAQAAAVQSNTPALANAASLTGTELSRLHQAGQFVKTSLSTIGNWITRTYLGFTQAGTGAISRTLQAKLRDRVSVKDFGAVGDGVVDDTAAIQAALSSGAWFVHIPAGTYKITTQLTCLPWVSITGDGGRKTTLALYDCDGLYFPSGNNEGDTAVYRDFGLEGKTGQNRVAINCPPSSGVKVGMYFERLRIWNMNQGIILASNLHCGVYNCHLEQINEGIRCGDICTFTRLRDNIIICAGGDTNGGTATKRGIYLQGGSNAEAIKVSGNFVFGFAFGLRVDTILDLNVHDNGFDGCTNTGISFTTVLENFNIRDNFIEVLGAGAQYGIFAAPVASEYPSKINITGNTFTQIGATSIIAGLMVHGPGGDSQQFHMTVEDNIFDGLSGTDIVMYLPGETFIRRNQCRSTAATNSIVIDDVTRAPVVIEDNTFLKAVSIPTARISTGTLVYRRNRVAGVYTPDQVSNQPWVPANASSDSVTITVNSAKYARMGSLCVASLDIVWPVTSGTQIARITLPAVPTTVHSGAIGYNDTGAQLDWSTSSGANNFVVYSASGSPLTNANLSGKRILATLIFDSV